MTTCPSSIRALVIVPCRNEEGRIGAVVRGARAALPGADVAVINDDSTDRTAREAREAGATVVPHPVNLGYGAALETGYMYALAHGYDAVLQMDGDGQHVAAELPALLAPLERGEADLVIGSRYGPGSAYRAGGLRRLGQAFFRGLVFLLAGARVTDPTSGFQALNRRTILFFLSGIFPSDYPDADVLTMCAKAGLRIREVPVRMLPRDGGVSMHRGWKPLYYVAKMLLSLLIVLLNRRLWRTWRAALAPAAGGTGTKPAAG